MDKNQKLLIQKYSKASDPLPLSIETEHNQLCSENRKQKTLFKPVSYLKCKTEADEERYYPHSKLPNRSHSYIYQVLQMHYFDPAIDFCPKNKRINSMPVKNKLKQEGSRIKKQKLQVKSEQKKKQSLPNIMYVGEKSFNLRNNYQISQCNIFTTLKPEQDHKRPNICQNQNLVNKINTLYCDQIIAKQYQNNKTTTLQSNQNQNYNNNKNQLPVQQLNPLPYKEKIVTFNMNNNSNLKNINNKNYIKYKHIHNTYTNRQKNQNPTENQKDFSFQQSKNEKIKLNLKRYSNSLNQKNKSQNHLNYSQKYTELMKSQELKKSKLYHLLLVRQKEQIVLNSDKRRIIRPLSCV